MTSRAIILMGILQRKSYLQFDSQLELLIDRLNSRPKFDTLTNIAYKASTIQDAPKIFGFVGSPNFGRGILAISTVTIFEEQGNGIRLEIFTKIPLINFALIFYFISIFLVLIFVFREAFLLLLLLSFGLVLVLIFLYSQLKNINETHEAVVDFLISIYHDIAVLQLKNINETHEEAVDLFNDI